jgi:hypothetical protein
VPLFKTGDKRDISCYRGVSILSAKSPKFFENIVCDKITPIIRPMISEAQHGFFKSLSTVTSLMQFSNFDIGVIDEERQVDAVYTDFSKAFDRVDHRLLLSNFSVRFRGSLLCWILNMMIIYPKPFTVTLVYHRAVI